MRRRSGGSDGDGGRGGFRNLLRIYKTLNFNGHPPTILCLVQARPHFEGALKLRNYFIIPWLSSAASSLIAGLRNTVDAVRVKLWQDEEEREEEGVTIKLLNGGIIESARHHLTEAQ